MPNEEEEEACYSLTMYLPTQESGIRIRRERAKEGGKEIPCESLLGKLWPRYVCGSKGGIYSRGKSPEDPLEKNLPPSPSATLLPGPK